MPGTAYRRFNQKPNITKKEPAKAESASWGAGLYERIRTMEKANRRTQKERRLANEQEERRKDEERSKSIGSVRLERCELEQIAQNGSAEKALAVLQHGSIEGEGHPYRREKYLPADIQITLAKRLKRQEIRNELRYHAIATAATLPAMAAAMNLDKTATLPIIAIAGVMCEIVLYAAIRQCGKANERKWDMAQLIRSGTLNSSEAAKTISSIRSLRDWYFETIFSLGNLISEYLNRRHEKSSLEEESAGRNPGSDPVGTAMPSPGVRVAVPALLMLDENGPALAADDKQEGANPQDDTDPKPQTDAPVPLVFGAQS